MPTGSYTSNVVFGKWEAVWEESGLNKWVTSSIEYELSEFEGSSWWSDEVEDRDERNSSKVSVDWVGLDGDGGCHTPIFDLRCHWHVPFNSTFIRHSALIFSEKFGREVF